MDTQWDSLLFLLHGVDLVTIHDHEDKPFRVSGILEPTGTPIDKVVIVSLAGIEAMHIDWHDGSAPIPGLEVSADEARTMNLPVRSVTAFYIGLKSRIATFQLQRYVNDYSSEALLAILPGVALQSLWQMFGVGESALFVISALVLLAGLVGMLTTILTSLNERRREVAILRSIGAKPVHVFLLLLSETFILTIAGCIFGVFLLYLSLIVGQPLAQKLGIYMTIGFPTQKEMIVLFAVVFLSGLFGLLPAWRGYKYSLADGLTIRI